MATSTHPPAARSLASDPRSPRQARVMACSMTHILYLLVHRARGRRCQLFASHRSMQSLRLLTIYPFQLRGTECSTDTRPLSKLRLDTPNYSVSTDCREISTINVYKISSGSTVLFFTEGRTIMENQMHLLASSGCYSFLSHYSFPARWFFLRASSGT